MGFHFERNYDGDLYDYSCLKSKSEVFIFFLIYTLIRFIKSTGVWSGHVQYNHS